MTLMQTYLILSHNPEFIDNQINLLKSKYQISPFDIYNVIPEKSLGIDDVRRTEKNSRIKPGYGNKKLVLIRDFHLATIEAQNAMLKFLEEPTPSTVIILTAVNDQKILATVLSRCFVIKEIKAETAVPDGKKLEKKILEILNMSSGERLVFSQKLISNREDAAGFIDSLTRLLENQLINKPSMPLSNLQLASLIEKTEAARRYVDRNVNFKLVIDILLLGFPSTKK